MPQFNNQPLFDSGPSRFHVGGLTLRRAEEAVPHVDGVHLVGQCREGRSITQTGTLLADDVNAVAVQLDAIDDAVDGLAHTLIDDTDRVWLDTVMLRFEPGPIRPAGPRVRVDYTIDYLQVKP